MGPNDGRTDGRSAANSLITSESCSASRAQHCAMLPYLYQRQYTNIMHLSADRFTQGTANTLPLSQEWILLSRRSDGSPSLPLCLGAWRQHVQNLRQRWPSDKPWRLASEAPSSRRQFFERPRLLTTTRCSAPGHRWGLPRADSLISRLLLKILHPPLNGHPKSFWENAYTWERWKCGNGKFSSAYLIQYYNVICLNHILPCR